jgi:hypothetical protein
LFENEKHPHASSLARQLSSIIINYHQLSVEFADNLRFPKEFLSFTQLVDLGFYSWSCFFCRIRGEMFQQDLDDLDVQGSTWTYTVHIPKKIEQENPESEIVILRPLHLKLGVTIVRL